MAIKGISTKDILFALGGIVVGAVGISLLKGFDFGFSYGLGGTPTPPSMPGMRTSYHAELSDVRSNLAELGFGRQSSSGSYNSFTLEGE